MKKNIGFFAYNPPTSGTYSIDGFIYHGGEDFRSVKRCKEYKACGFDKMQLRYEYAYNGEEWETSQTKYMWDIAYKAGIKKLLVTDYRIDNLIRCETLIGEGGKFRTRESLDKEIEGFVSVYKDKAGFYGIQLLDEPQYPMLTSYGEVVNSLKRVLPNAYLQVNLMAMSPKIEGIDDQILAYEKYANEILDKTGLDHISFDDYPFSREYIIAGWNICGYQILSRICRDRGVQFQTVLQSFSNATGGIFRKRKVTEKDMYYQMNVAMGFGAREIAFYTYMPKFNFGYQEGGDGIDGACFINNDGTRSALYYFTKRIIKEAQKFSSVFVKYRYQNSYFVTEQGRTKADFDHIALAEDNGESPIPVKVDKGVALVTEQRNDKGCLYMIENIGNVKEELFNNQPPMQVVFSLPKGRAKFYFRGKRIRCKKVNDSFVYRLKVGDAIFIEVKKA